MRRRSVLLVPVVTAVQVAALAGCRQGEASAGASPSSEGLATSSPSDSSPATASSSATPVFSQRLVGSSNDGSVMTVEVGPAVRVGEHTVVRLSFETDSKEIESVHLSGDGTLSDVCLLSMERGLVWLELDTSHEAMEGGTNYSLAAGEASVLYPVFGQLDEEVSSVQVLVPNFGVALGVPVVDEDQAGFPVKEAMTSRELKRSDTGPHPIEWFSAAADGSFDVSHQDDAVTMTLSSDVTFEVDSAELTAQADTVLGASVSELSLYPSGGELSIVGHTDDVADEAYNQALSERRAQAVADRLAQLTSLSAWSVSVSGKGETEPRVEGMSEEARAANRRVEIVATLENPSEASAASLSDLATQDPPEAQGAVGPGPDGVEYDIPTLGRVRLQLDKVVQVGGFLVGNVQMTSLEADRETVGTSLILPAPFRDRWAGRGGASQAGPECLTLLAGGVRYLAADYQLSSGVRQPLMSMNLAELGKDVPASLPVVWPATGQDTITVDLPGTGDKNVPGPLVRLTDVPVVAS